jgi:hypothetical protein
MTAPLTRKERRLLAEAKAIAVRVRVDVWNVECYHRKALALYLEIAKDKLIRSEIVNRYVLVDEYLTDIIGNYYFRRKPMKRHSTCGRLWKTKRFKHFVHHLMDARYLIQKMDLVHAIAPIPTKVRNAIHRINDIRNTVAHSLFPQNLRRYMPDKKVMYGGANLFTLDGLETFLADYKLVDDYLTIRLFGK